MEGLQWVRSKTMSAILEYYKPAECVRVAEVSLQWLHSYPHMLLEKQIKCVDISMLPS